MARDQGTAKEQVADVASNAKKVASSHTARAVVVDGSSSQKRNAVAVSS